MSYDFHEQGVPEIQEATCAGCGQCVRICPDEVLAMDGDKPRAGAGLLLGCIACGQCMAVCPTASIGVSGRGMTPDDRIALPPAGQQATADQLEALMTARRSLRRFTTKDVPRELLDRIVRIAATAPMGIPPSDVGVVVFEGRRQVQSFAEDACRCFSRAAAFFHPVTLALMRPFVGKAKYEVFRDFIRPLLRFLPKMQGQGRDLFTYDAPAAIVFHHGPAGDASDSMIAATYAMLAAESLGLGSCMLGTTVALTQDKRLKAKYGIPPENRVGVTLIVGYPAVKFQYAVRRRLASVRYVN
jgi:nitroreductase/NAD-dependent dihydropyrimidine dehydrogenase PreA subunit